jgi:hypothetical protein
MDDRMRWDGMGWDGMGLAIKRQADRSFHNLRKAAGPRRTLAPGLLLGRVTITPDAELLYTAHSYIPDELRTNLWRGWCAFEARSRVWSSNLRAGWPFETANGRAETAQTCPAPAART